MVLRMLLLLALLMFSVHSQGIPDEKPLTVSTFTDGLRHLFNSTSKDVDFMKLLETCSAVAEPLTSARPISMPREGKRRCNCRGKESELVNTPCRCQPSVRRRGRRGKSKRLCQLKKYKHLKTCSIIFRSKNGGKPGKFDPSVPI